MCMSKYKRAPAETLGKKKNWRLENPEKHPRQFFTIAEYKISRKLVKSRQQG